jgi:formylglycine-generating enzyme required for sulfatase activity
VRIRSATAAAGTHPTLTALVALLASCLPMASTAGELAGPVLRDCPDCPELVPIAAGRFTLGTSSDGYEHDDAAGETPPLPVTLRQPFAIGRFEITQAQFTAFLDATGTARSGSCAAQPPASPATPATCIALEDAERYAAWLTSRTGHRYRLPSEAEWEYAARAGSAGARSWSARDSHEGVSISRACDYANVYDVSARDARLPIPHARCTDAYPGVAPVGSYLPNPWGLYDTIGNVRERVADCFTRSYKGRPADERAWRWSGCTHHGVRGGSWRSRPRMARSAARDFVADDVDPEQLFDVGFRIARDLDESERPAP